MKAFQVEQSLPICCSLAALGGILEVAATAVTAIPAVREKEGITLKWWVQILAIAGNVGLQAIGSVLSHLIATWFGPVSLVVPFFYSATLLSNMLIFGLLGETFTKNMRVGTHVIVVAVILLPVVGPNTQEHQDIGLLIQHWYARCWFWILVAACGITGAVLATKDLAMYSMRTRTIILLVARATAISVNLTVSRAFILGPGDSFLVLLVVLKLVSGAIYTYAIVIQSFVVEQARFVPLNATIIIVVNAITGILVWEDWKVLSSWYGYACIFVLLGLGCDLLLSVPLLNAENPEFGTKRRASLIMEKASSFRRRSRSYTSPATIYEIQMDLNPPVDTPEAYKMNYHIRTSGSTDEENEDSLESPSRANRVNAWKQLLSPITYYNQTPPRYQTDGATTDEVLETKTENRFTEDSPFKTPIPKKLDSSTPPNETTSLFEPNQLDAGAGPMSAAQPPLSGAFHSSAETPHLSRLAAWRATVSPMSAQRRLSQRLQHPMAPSVDASFSRSTSASNSDAHAKNTPEGT